jgi:hypothetical protein
MKKHTLIILEWRIRRTLGKIKNISLFKTIDKIIFRWFVCDYREKDCPFVCDGCGSNGKPDECYWSL